MADELILIVEDVDLLREGLREILTLEGFSVLTARNGKEALERMQQRPDLIVSDITMPVMNGYDFYNAVRAHPEWVAIPFIFLSARNESADLLAGRHLGVDDYLTKPISRDELVTAVRSRLNRFHQAQMGRIQQAYLDSLVTLANAIESRSPQMSGHIEHISEISVLVAGALGWPEKKQTELRFAAILHDIGKIHIPATILFKPGRLTDQEWELVRQHPATGAVMLKDVPYLVECIPAVLHHHERWDGRGYPDGLAENEIPEGARILAVVDALDAMLTERPFASRRSLEAACAEISELSGRYYDPAIVEIVQKLQNTGQIQAVLDRHQSTPSEHSVPIIRGPV